MVGEEEVRRFEKFYKLGSVGFRLGKIQLHRYTLRPISSNWAVMGEALPTDAVRLLA
jgi:cyclopropane-fatty-acyl-phospholipid synthase